MSRCGIALFVIGIWNAQAVAQLPNKTIDLRDTPTAKKIVSAIDRILPGNRSSVSLDSFVADLAKLEIRGTLKIRAAHRWGRWSPPFGLGDDVDIAASTRATGRFSYSLRNNQIRGTAEIPLGRIGVNVAGQPYSKNLGTLRLSLDDIEQIIDGDWDVLLRKIPNFDVIKREHDIEYKTIRRSYEKRYGKENVYFASPKFVHWASSERLGKWAVVGVLTGGANLKGVMKQVQKKSLEELKYVQAWLQKRGLRAAKEAAIAVLKGEKVSFPYMALKWQSVAYKSRVRVLDRPISPWVTIRHGAFVIIWKKGTNNVVDDRPLGPNVANKKTDRTYRLRIGRSASGKLSRRDGWSPSTGKYYDTYLVRLERGKKYVFDLKGNFDTYLHLSHDSKRVAFNDDYKGERRHSRMVYSPGKDGVYRLIVSSYAKGTTGDYRLSTSVESTSGTTTKFRFPSIAVGGMRSGSLSTSDPLSKKGKRFDIYVAELKSGRTYTFQLKGNYDTYLRLYAGGKQVSYNDDHKGNTRLSQITYRPTSTGKHYLIVTAYEKNATGTYTLVARAGTSGSTKPASPKTIAIGTTSSGELTSSDSKDRKDKYFDEYFVRLTGGRSYTFDLKGNFDTYLRLGSRTKRIASNDDYKSTRRSRIVYKAPATGTYVVTVTSFGKSETGSYQLSAAWTSTPSPRPKPKPKPTNRVSVLGIAVGSPRGGALSSSDGISSKKKYYDIYIANLIGGRKYVVDLVSQDFDPYLYVERGTTAVGSNDDYKGSRKHSRVTFTASRSGQYRFIVTSFKERATGRYSLSLGAVRSTPVRPKPRPKPQPNGSTNPRRGVLSRGDFVNRNKYYDVHVFTFQTGRAYTIELTSSAFDAYLVLQDSRKRILDRNDDAFGRHSRIVFRPKRTGTYRVIATSLNARRTGAYNLFIRSTRLVSR